jgi:PAS domain S-box-containing protein
MVKMDAGDSQRAKLSLRKLAEEKSGPEDGGAPQESLSSEEVHQMLHELRVHQIELEMQNEELRRTQTELKESRSRYFDLYDLAPVGYITLSETWLILEANLTATTLLGVTRSDLVKQSLARFILPEDQDIYYQYRKHNFTSAESRVCELRLVNKAERRFLGANRGDRRAGRCRQNRVPGGSEQYHCSQRGRGADRNPGATSRRAASD